MSGAVTIVNKKNQDFLLKELAQLCSAHFQNVGNDGRGGTIWKQNLLQPCFVNFARKFPTFGNVIRPVWRCVFLRYCYNFNEKWPHQLVIWLHVTLFIFYFYALLNGLSSFSLWNWRHLSAIISIIEEFLKFHVFCVTCTQFN